MLIEVKIGALIMDPNTNTPIVILKSINSKPEAILPIWVGAYEANSIALEIEKIASPRPITHDLLKNFILQVGLTVSKVIITDLRNNTFYGLIELIDREGSVTTLDARPSDAIALALRLDCSIFVRQTVFDISASANAADVNLKDDAVASAEEWPDLIS